MKVKISYLPQEERDATAALTALQLRHPDGRTRRSDRHPPYRQIYFSVSGEKGTINAMITNVYNGI
jgi:hypothetical protein